MSPGAGSKEPGTLVFLGTYTDYSVLPHWPAGTREGEGFAVARWLGDGRLDVLKIVPCENPAFMKYHPFLNVLYVLSECIDKPGYLTAYRVDPATAELSQLGRLDMTGRSTCYISFDAAARHAVITNYWDGLLNVVELGRDGTPLGIVQEHQQSRRATWRQVVDRPDHMANRQDGPHAHCCVFHPSYRWLFVPDLGDNAIHQYAYECGRLRHQAAVVLPPGEGPRHLVMHPSLPVAYSGCELLSRVQVFALDDARPDEVRPRIAALQSFPTLPGGWAGTNYVGEIKVDRAGRFLYVSNRGHNSIAVFAIDPVSGLLTPVGIEPTLGECPRHFGLSPCGRFCVVGDQDSDVVKVFDVCASTGRLAPLRGGEYPLPTPNFVLFARPHAVHAGRAAGPPAVLVDALPAAAAHAGHGATEAEAGRPGGHEERLVSPTAMVACS